MCEKSKRARQSAPMKPVGGRFWPDGDLAFGRMAAGILARLRRRQVHYLPLRKWAVRCGCLLIFSSEFAQIFVFALTHS